VYDNARSDLNSDQPVLGGGLVEVLPSLIGTGRSGRLSATQDDGPRFEMWIDHGRVVHAAWGHMRALSALEMAAVYLPRANFVFSEGQRSGTRSFDLSPTDLRVRLAEVAREGAALTALIPGPQAVPSSLQLLPTRLARDFEAQRVLDQIDGHRTVAELVDDRQPLIVLRGLARLVEQGVITFEPTETLQAPPAPEPAPVAATVEGAPPTSAPANRVMRPLALALALGVLVLVIVFAVRSVNVARQAEVPGAPSANASVAGVQTRSATEPTPVQPAATAAPTAPAQEAPVVAPALATQPSPTVAPPTQPPAPTLAPPTPTAPPAFTPTAAPRILLDETFTSGAPGWPNAPNAAAFWDARGYHLEPRLAGQHLAVAAPVGTSLTDIAVTGLLRKSGGPSGGGYGLILRAQGATLDGTAQGGRYYVFEVGDRGEVGAWRRQEDRWVELKPWTASEAVHSGIAENRLEVRTTGSQFTFIVNDAQVAQLTDATLTSGAVGVFTGGDGNQVVLERFTATAI
jgi:hypothetical protein